MELAPFPLSRNGCRGFIGPVPPPLWMRPAMCRPLYPGPRRHARRACDAPMSANGEHEAMQRALAALAPIDESARRRALVIVNPHAASVSDRAARPRDPRARSALRARGASRRSARATRPRSRAPRRATGYDLVIAFGGDGTVNEVANGLAGSPVPLSCLPGGSANVFCKLLGIPGEIVDATEHLLATGRPLRAAPGRPRARRGTALHVQRRHRHRRATSCARVDARPDTEAPLRPLVLHSRWPARWSCAATSCGAPRMFVDDGDGDVRPASPPIVQNAEHYTYFHDRPIDIADGVALDGGELCRRRAANARASSALGALLVRALLPRARVSRHRQVASFRGSGRSRSDGATGGRCRSRSTATTSARSPRRASRSVRGR